MAHTIHLDVPGYGKAVVICNGDFSGTLKFRAWKSEQPFHNEVPIREALLRAEEQPVVDVELPHGFGQAFVRAYLERKLTSAVETHLPRLLRLLDRI